MAATATARGDVNAGDSSDVPLVVPSVPTAPRPRPTILERPFRRGPARMTKRPRGSCDLRRAPRDLCVCTRPALVVPSVDKRNTACLGRALVPHRCPTTSCGFSNDLPIEPRQAHVPFLFAPPRQASHHVPDRPAKRSIDAVAPLPRRETASVRLALLRRCPSSGSSPSPSGWQLLRLGRNAVVSSSSSPSLMLGLGEKRAARPLDCRVRRPGISVTRWPRLRMLSSREPRSLSTSASNTCIDRRSRSRRDIHR